MGDRSTKISSYLLFGTADIQVRTADIATVRFGAIRILFLLLLLLLLIGYFAARQTEKNIYYL